MIVNANLADIIYTHKISGIPANFLIPSLKACGLDPDRLEEKSKYKTQFVLTSVAGGIDFGHELGGKAWKDIWSAGQGVGAIESCPSTAELVKQMKAEYDQAKKELCSA